MDTDSLQDILQYSGVDLKAESDAIMKEQDFLLSQVAFSSGNDPHARANLLFNVDFLKSVLTSIASKYKLNNAMGLDPQIMEYLLYALQARIAVSGKIDC